MLGLSTEGRHSPAIHSCTAELEITIAAAEAEAMQREALAAELTQLQLSQTSLAAERASLINSLAAARQALTASHKLASLCSKASQLDRVR